MYEVGQVFVGYGDAAVDVASGAYHVVRHPINTVCGVAHVVAHPVQTWDAATTAIGETWESGNRGKGRVVGNIIAAVAPTAVAKAGTAAEVGNAVSKAEELASASRIAEVANIETKASAASEVATSARNIAKTEQAVGEASEASAGRTVGELRDAGLKDAHHTIQDAAVRDIPGYDTNLAAGEQLAGPSTRVGSPHYKATQVQRQAGGGTYGAERRIGYKALRKAGLDKSAARSSVERADKYFESLGVTKETPTRIPGNRQ